MQNICQTWPNVNLYPIFFDHNRVTFNIDEEYIFFSQLNLSSF
jgi:hypothetical protein